ncbi:hypothetical protein dsx2_0487 [Desulfovibrio sp. X2]|uniref:hypothetical protein n=1 Tax=Desulfovibrio sp. X2 TaxID=941449 RepID=UPI000358F4CD|nr:hypothetical protein [Desulfovibrio sp. X2]EPR38678.1 hypothetical protein dsx2_0487 [Desulfovibrio sp. X2]
MSKITAQALKPAPEFDIMYYMSLCGETRIEQSRLEMLEPLWAKWLPHLKAYRLAAPGDTRASGHLIAFLEAPVEEEIEELWQTSPSDGMAAHNLAISLVMQTTASLIPKVAEGGCAPLTRPTKDLRRAFERLGLEWNEEGTVNRQYAVFTPMPYAGGCRVCFLRSSCPKSTARDE